jgi:3-isopropylmalate/(R)-2-methylmalate dehydratase large subunit
MVLKTLLDKIWEDHVVHQEPGCPSILYIDLHLLHEVTSPQAFDGLRRRGLRVRHPSQCLGTVDHSIPTTDRSQSVADPLAAKQIGRLEENCREYGLPLFGPGSRRQGVIHVIGPEMGAIQPGMTVVCGDSHTATHGAFGALAFGIGTSEVENVLATQCLLQSKPKNFEVRIDGCLGPGVSAKDVILALIARIGVGGGTGHVFEYKGEAIHRLSMEERMTVCNMSIEGGARAGLMAPDNTTFQYIAGKPFAPREDHWTKALAKWKQLASDQGALYDRSVDLDLNLLEPMITYGNNPGMAIPVSGRIPDPDHIPNHEEKNAVALALRYMGLQPGQPILGQPIDVVFLGSCTNGRLLDLQQAADLLKGSKIHPRVRMLVVPGSGEVKRHAESLGLDRIFLEAGAEWREPGCSMCIAMNGDDIQAGQYCVSTSNRNFEGRQGKGGRTFLASPATAAASALAGAVADCRRLGNS